MSVATYLYNLVHTALGGTAYKNAIDGNFNVAQRYAGAFAPHEQTVPAMTVRIDPGMLFLGSEFTTSTLLEVAAQSTGAITAPVGNPRIDRVVVDTVTGAVSVITGTPAGSPTAPALTQGKMPICQVLLQTSSTAITNSMITDERPLFWNPGQLSFINGGIKWPTTQIPATNTTNVMDDFKRDSWTIRIRDVSNSDGEGQAYAAASGYVLKIGNYCFISGDLRMSNIGTLSGGIWMCNLPYTSKTSNLAGGITISEATGLAIPANSSITGQILANDTRMSLQVCDQVTGTRQMTAAELTSAGILRFNGFYQAAN